MSNGRTNGGGRGRGGVGGVCVRVPGRSQFSLVDSAEIYHFTGALSRAYLVSIWRSSTLCIYLASRSRVLCIVALSTIGALVCSRSPRVSLATRSAITAIFALPLYLAATVLFSTRPRCSRWTWVGLSRLSWSCSTMGTLPYSGVFISILDPQAALAGSRPAAGGSLSRGHGSDANRRWCSGHTLNSMSPVFVIWAAILDFTFSRFATTGTAHIPLTSVTTTVA